MNTSPHEPLAPASLRQLRESIHAFIRSRVKDAAAAKGVTQETLYREALRLTEFGGVPQVERARRLGLSASAACVAGAASVAELKRFLVAAGFVEARVEINAASRAFINDWLPGARGRLCGLSPRHGAEAVRDVLRRTVL